MKERTKNIALVSIIAAGIGYIAGILTAPKSGKETRKDIKDAAVKGKKEIEKRIKTLHAEISKLIEISEKQLQTLRGKANEELRQALEKAKVAKEKAREVLSALHEGEADDKDLDKAVNDLRAAVTNLKKYIQK